MNIYIILKIGMANQLKLVVMQSKQLRRTEEHANCAKDLEDETQTPMTKCLYNGTLELINTQGICELELDNLKLRQLQIECAKALNVLVLQQQLNTIN